MNEPISVKDLVGKTAGAYQIEQLVEENALGAIYIARAQVPASTYRLRVLRPSTTASPESRMVFLGQFQQQARELAALLTDEQRMPKHPHLLPLVDFGNIQGIPYLVWRQAPMRRFTELLNTPKELDILTIGFYLDQIASALEYAHEHATLHRDLSSDVVYMRDDGRIVIADLGVMRLLELSLKDELQTALYTHSLSSTPAPEQLLNQPENTYTDVYALGALLYRLLTGHRAYSARSFTEIVEQHLHAPVPSLSKWRQIVIGQRDITPDLDKLIAAAMAKDTQQRIQHPAELANAYHQIISPNDTTRQPIVSSLIQAATTLPTASAAETRPARYRERALRSNASTIATRSARMRNERRRTLILMGVGTIVAVGAAAFIVEELLSTQGTATANNSINTTSTSSAKPAATSTNGGSTSSQATPTQAAVSGNIIAHTSAVPSNSAISFKNPNPNSLHPAVLIHLSNNQFVAFDSTCTHHASCSVSYNPQDKLLECPCHGAQFNPAQQAAVVQGPADRPLASVPITIHSDGTITTA
jgi:serine/threonine protein kinase